MDIWLRASGFVLLELPDALRWRVGLAAFADMDAFRIYGAPLHAVSDSHRLIWGEEVLIGLKLATVKSVTTPLTFGYWWLNQCIF